MKAKRGKKQPSQPEIPTPSRDVYIPLWEKTSPLEVDCDIIFGDEFIQVTFKEEVLRHIMNKAAEFIHVPNFDMKRSLYVKVGPTYEIVDYFNNPLAHQPIGKYNGRVKMQTKWLVKSQNGFFIKPSISTIFVLHKY